MSRSSTRTNTGWWAALGAVGLLTAVGFYAVLSVRFGGGEAYPNYSTLRADPLGTRALFEALDRLPQVESVRSFEQLQKLDGKTGDTLMLLNVSTHVFNSDGETVSGSVVSRFAAAGGRVVIAIDSGSGFSRTEGFVDKSLREVEEERRAERERKDKEKNKTDGKAGDPRADKSGNDQDEAKSKVKKGTTNVPHEPALAEALKVSLNGREFIYSGKDGASLTLAQNLPLAPVDLPHWFSSISINDDPAQDWHSLSDRKIKKPGKEKPDKKADQDDATRKVEAEAIKPSAWHLVADQGGRAMIMERKLGTGSVVICTDSFFASNEALWSSPKANFLSWIVGGAGRVIFDETHLGSSIGDEDSLVTLARRYRMHGLFIGALLLFGLYIWRNSMSLVPPDEAEDLGYWRKDAVAGQSAAAGLEGLLRRGIARKKMLTRCFETWESTPTAANVVPPAHRARARSALAEAAGMKQVAAGYQKLRDILHPTRK